MSTPQPVTLSSDSISIAFDGRSLTAELPRDVVSWLAARPRIVALLRELAADPKFRRRLVNGAALRDLVLLLYARGTGVAPYLVARRFSTSHEQLYRMERGLKKDGLYDMVLGVLGLLELDERTARDGLRRPTA